jgi:hypothetical protein
MIFEIKTQQDIENLAAELTKKLETSKKGLSVKVANITRTQKQNNALHSTIAELRIKLNESGFSYKEFLAKNKELEVLWTNENIKELFKTVIKAMYKKHSTTKLTTTEIQEAWQVFDSSN